MQAHRSPTGGPTPTTFLVAFQTDEDAHLAAEQLEQLGFRAVLVWTDRGSNVEAGALTDSDTAAIALSAVEAVAARYRGRVDHARGGWRAGDLEFVRPTFAPASTYERAELSSLWSHLIETTTNNDPSPFTALCSHWAEELEARFDDWRPPTDGWLTIELGEEAAA